jgi:tRNA(fMet)-specific endonuclease VapC
MLDTNMVIHILKSHPKVLKSLTAKPIASVCISAITEAELKYGLAKRPEAKRLHLLVREFLRAVDVLPWDSAIAERYGSVRFKMEKDGKGIAPLDLLIAAHALDTRSILVTNDQAFKKVPELKIEDWTV